MKLVDSIINKITMYRLMLYFLLILFAMSVFLSAAKILPYDFIDILLGGAYLVVVCSLANYIFARLFKAKTNLESATITALILTLIVGPFTFFENIPTLTFMGIAAMASKYIFVIRKKHIFNPAAIAILLSAVILKAGASWWIGSLYTLPIIALGGLLILIKIKRFKLVLSFLILFFLSSLLSQSIALSIFLAPAFWFFVFVMLVEPLTSPSAKKFQIIFGGFVATVYIFSSKIFPSYAYGLESALLVGNLFNLSVSPTINIILEFVKKEKSAKNTWSFYFKPMSKFNFLPGQYLEWTLPHKKSDSRGIRRFFTISSSPNEPYISITARVTKHGSSFKDALFKMKPGEELVASSPQGEFTLPKNESLPLAFIAGGIGVTPFRSMVKFLLEEGKKRDIVLLYSNNNKEDVAFKKTLDITRKVGVKTIYIMTQEDGYIEEDMIRQKMPDYQKRAFYISGSEPMVQGFKKMLTKMKVKTIKTDYFPGYTDKHQE